MTFQNLCRAVLAFSTPAMAANIHLVEKRQVRSKDYLLNNESELRRVVPLGEAPAKPNEPPDSEKEAAARKALQEVFENLEK